MRIRYAKESDFYNGLIECLDSLFGVYSYKLSEMVRRLRKKTKMGVKTFVAVRNGVVIASATLVLEVKLTKKLLAGHLEDVCVMKECQGAGVGTMLINHIIKLYKKKCYKIDLVSDNKNLKFYSKFKFVRSGNLLRINL